MFAFTRRRLLSDRTALARWGERRAMKFLKKLGLTTLARNYLCKTGELDLVMTEPDGTIVFVEVKTRTNRDIAEPEDSITASKKHKLSSATQYFLKTHKIENHPCRFDVVAITLDQRGPENIKHYRSAFV
jgi:putative endonuclease